MIPEVVEQLLRMGAMKQSLHPLRRFAMVPDPHFLGFDAEWLQDDRTLCMQLWGSDEIGFKPFQPARETGLDDLIRLVKDTVDLKHDRRPLYLLTYWSDAELSRMGLFWKEDPRVKMVPCHPGLWNVTFDIAVGAQRVPVTVFDVYHYAKGKLSQTLDEWGLPSKLEYDVTALTQESLDDPKFILYAMYDPEGVYHWFVEKLRPWCLQHLQVDPLLRPSVAGMFTASYRHRYVQVRIGNPSSLIRRTAMHGYKGANNQMFRWGEYRQPLRAGDGKALYPLSTIQLGKLPRAEDWREATWDDLGSAIGGVCVIDFAYPDDCYYPGLPVHHDGFLLFPLRGKTVCTLSEVRVALSQGCDVNLRRAFAYDDGDPTLAEFMKELVALRDEADAQGQKGLRNFIKLGCNSPIGKLGQHHGGTDLTLAAKFCEEHGIDLEFFMQVGNFATHPAKDHYRIGSTWLPEWPCLILGEARSVMAGVIPKVGAWNCTTDSFVCRPGDEINHWGDIPFGDEGTYDHAHFFRTRLYYLDEGHDPARPFKAAHHALHQNTKDAYETLRTKSTTYTRSKGTKLPESIRRGVHVNTREDREMTVSLGWDYKRRPLLDGTTLPWRTVEDYDRATRN